LLVHPKWIFPLFIRVDEEFAKGQMQQPDKNIFAVRNTMNRVKKVESTLYILWENSKKVCERGIVTSECGFTLAYDSNTALISPAFRT
jgi:hypothetical protein